MVYNCHVNRNAGVLLILCALTACAGPRAAGPGEPFPAPPSPAPPPPATQAPPAAALLPSYPLVKDDPQIAEASRRLDVGGTAARPSLLLARAREAVAAGQKIRSEQGDAMTLPGSAPDYQKFLALYDLAYRDLYEVLALFPAAPEAPEAHYMMGLIHDHRHLDNFEEALGHYRQAVERHPGTPWAKKAGERIEYLEKFIGGMESSPHGR